MSEDDQNVLRRERDEAVRQRNEANLMVEGAKIAVGKLQVELAMAREDLMMIARAVGVVFEADGHAVEPGPTNEIIAEIRRLQAGMPIHPTHPAVRMRLARHREWLRWARERSDAGELARTRAGALKPEVVNEDDDD